MRRCDDLGTPVTLPVRARRVVSLVPSLTEALASVDRSALVGATTFCTAPTDLDVARVRGPKNPDVAAIAALRPDVVVANKEENRALDVARLRERGIAVWVTDIESLDDAFSSMRRLFDALGWDEPTWLADAMRTWGESASLGLRAVVPIWRDPWLVVGRPTYTADLLARLGVEVLAPSGRYPHADVADLVALRPDVVLLPDEPYPFHGSDGPEAFPGLRTRLLDGRLLFWYGPGLVEARARLLGLLA